MSLLQRTIPAVHAAPRAAHVHAVLRYDPASPFEVRIRVSASHGASLLPLECVLARDLLTDGLARPVGEGTVRLQPLGMFWTRIDVLGDRLTSLVVATQALREFDRETAELVPPQTEGQHVDWDSVVRLLVQPLSGEAPEVDEEA